MFRVETVFTAHNIISKKIELQTNLTVVGGFQNTCAGRVSSSALSIHSLILDPSLCLKTSKQTGVLTVPAWVRNWLLYLPGGAANGIPLNTSI